MTLLPANAELGNVFRPVIPPSVSLTEAGTGEERFVKSGGREVVGGLPRREGGSACLGYRGVGVAYATSDHFERCYRGTYRWP